MKLQLDAIDVIILIMSMGMVALIGLYFTNKNRSIDAYMLGDRRLSVLPVAVSLMTSCLSGLTLLGASAELYYQGPTYAFVAIPMLLSGPITACTMLPVFYHLNELSLYKYLHLRYGNLIKNIVTLVFMVQMLLYNSVVLYLPTMALESLLGLGRFYTILLVGLICVAYSGIGGIKAVVWTDLIQAIFMYAAIVAVGVLGTYDAGGIGEVISQAAEQGRFSMNSFWNSDLTTRHTYLGILFGSTLKHVYLVGVNQVQIQRALSLPTLRQSQMAFVYCSMFGALFILLSTYLGAVMVAAYRSCDPYLAKEIARRDAIIVHYVANRLARVPGIKGMFVAGIISATLSTVSSFANSMAALTLQDFIKPLMSKCTGRELTDSSRTWLAKILAITFGVLCVAMAYAVEKANSRLLQMTTTMFGAVGVPFLTAFALGIFTRFTNTLGILAGFSVTLTLGIYVTIYQSFFKPPLAPQMATYYNDQCERVFNMTLDSSQLPLKLDEEVWGPPAEIPFSLDRISYMMLPAVQFVLMVIIATVVSLLTCGWEQQVDDILLVDIMKDNKTANCRNISSTRKAKNIELALENAASDKQRNNCAGGVINNGFSDEGH